MGRGVGVGLGGKRIGYGYWYVSCPYPGRCYEMSFGVSEQIGQVPYLQLMIVVVIGSVREVVGWRRDGQGIREDDVLPLPCQRKRRWGAWNNQVGWIVKESVPVLVERVDIGMGLVVVDGYYWYRHERLNLRGCEAQSLKVRNGLEVGHFDQSSCYRFLFPL